MPRKRAATKAPTLHRCRAVTSVVNVEREFSREFGVGALVDLDEEVYPGTKLGELVRDGCFEPVEAAAAAADVLTGPEEDDEP